MKLNALNLTGLAAAMFLVLSPPAFAEKNDKHRAGQISAMTQNMYIGAEILSIAVAPGLCELMAAADAAVDQVLANDITQRADALAKLIAAEQPEVVGLQESFRVILSDLSGTPYYFDDYLALLISALSDQGVVYYAAASRTSAAITVPADSNRDCDPDAPSLGAADYYGTIVDNDVILCRSDIACSSGISSNFTFNAEAITPAGPIIIERGWVSVVATVKGRDVRVANTHLEVDSTPSFRAVQFAQALELSTVLDALAADGLPQVVLGDFNSEDSLVLPICDFFDPCFSGYQIMAGSGFLDAWLERGGRTYDGFTCCQNENLLNNDSLLGRRIDQVWARGSTNHYGGPDVRGVRADVLGDKQQDRSFPDNLWPSDHAGVVADIVIRSPK